MSGPEPEAGRILDPLRRTIRNVQGLLSTRLELASVELAEEKFRLVQLVLLAAAVAGFGLLVLLCATFLVVVLTWDTPARPWVLSGFVLIYTGATWWSYRRLRTHLHHGPPPFAGTIEEFRRDRTWFSNEN